MKTVIITACGTSNWFQGARLIAAGVLKRRASHYQNTNITDYLKWGVEPLLILRNLQVLLLLRLAPVESKTHMYGSSIPGSSMGSNQCSTLPQQRCPSRCHLKMTSTAPRAPMTATCPLGQARLMSPFKCCSSAVGQGALGRVVVPAGGCAAASGQLCSLPSAH